MLIDFDWYCLMLVFTFTVVIFPNAYFNIFNNHFRIQVFACTLSGQCYMPFFANNSEPFRIFLQSASFTELASIWHLLAAGWEEIPEKGQQVVSLSLCRETTTVLQGGTARVTKEGDSWIDIGEHSFSTLIVMHKTCSDGHYGIQNCEFSIIGWLVLNLLCLVCASWSYSK